MHANSHDSMNLKWIFFPPKMQMQCKLEMNEQKKNIQKQMSIEINIMCMHSRRSEIKISPTHREGEATAAAEKTTKNNNNFHDFLFCIYLSYSMVQFNNKKREKRMIKFHFSFLRVCQWNMQEKVTEEKKWHTMY